MGIGLSICQTIVEAHGGRIWTSTRAEPGATFHVALPLNRQE
jgi:signal transduction histidine kinase